MKSSVTVAALMGLGSVAQAQTIASHCPITDICYKLNIPDTTASSGSGDIYFQISAPTTYSWVALGQGTGMPNSNIFVVYTSSDGQNVTLSPRLGTGYSEPQHTSDTDVELLEGSGVSDGVMTANVRCGNCNSWGGDAGTMDFTSGSNSNWIYGYHTGDSLNSDDVEESISRHNEADEFTWDLAAAQGGENVNPFTSAAASSDITTPVMNGTTNGTAAAGSGSDGLNSDAMLLAHGVLASLAFVAIFPVGGIIIRVASFTGLLWVHGLLQLLGYAVFTTAFGLGVWYAVYDNYLHEPHAIIGIVLFVLLFAQPFGGILHHHLFKKTGGRTIVSYLHINLGRFAIILGMINGGLGMQLSGVATKYVIAYSVCAAVVGIAYIAAIIFGEVKRSRRASAETAMFELNESSSQEGMAKRAASERETLEK